MILRNFKQLKFAKGVVIFDKVLFLHQENRGQRQFEHFLGNINIKQSSVDNYQRNIQFNKEISKALNFQYLHIVFPAKPYSYRQKFQEIGLDLKPIFQKCHEDVCVFYPDLGPEHYDNLDTHINDRGMYHILLHILDELNLSKPPRPFWDKKRKRGDLSIMLGDNSATEEVEELSGIYGNDVYQSKRYTNAKALKGNQGHIDYLFNPYAMHNKRVILFGDSFFRTKIRMYSLIFTEVIYFRRPYVMSDVVRNLRPDIVLTGNAERYLTDVPDHRNDTPWFIIYLSDKYDSRLLSPNTIEVFKVLFSGRESQAFKERFGLKLDLVPRTRQELLDWTLDNITTREDVNYIRDVAISYEDKDIHLAIHLMSLAHLARPEGPLIKRKLDSYRRELELVV
ncbi:hypothetical protein [Vibrio rotiferianus]|uniref:hypothetical protein n=1 Tax=Vibrio rotiferianus TaxID=190895 RepID=UPI0015F69727|nr:hypothetical protein [Vibrio rotiferianus]